MSNEYKEWLKDKYSLHWYVYQKKFNLSKETSEENVIIRDVFDNWKFYEFAVELKDKQNSLTFDEFSKELQSEARYRFWSKFEYETEICGYGEERGRSKKIDVFDQLNLNWDVFVKYVWDVKENE